MSTGSISIVDVLRNLDILKREGLSSSFALKSGVIGHWTGSMTSLVYLECPYMRNS